MSQSEGYDANPDRYVVPRRHKALIASVTAVALFLSGCGGTAQSKKITAVSNRPTSVRIVPNFAKLTKNGTCEGGARLACAQPLYEQPREIRPLQPQDIVNYVEPEPGNPQQSEIAWPVEAFDGAPGNPVTVVCQVLGEKISNAYGNSTNVWDVVRVPIVSPNPASPELSATAIQEAESGTSSFGVERVDGNVTAVYAFASALWLGDQTHLGLPACTAAENPGNYPAAA